MLKNRFRQPSSKAIHRECMSGADHNDSSESGVLHFANGRWGYHCSTITHEIESTDPLRTFQLREAVHELSQSYINWQWSWTSHSWNDRFKIAKAMQVICDL